MKPYARLLFIPLVMALAACLGSDDKDPVAGFTATCVEFLCVFDASESVDHAGRGLNYSWSFGDDTSGGNTQVIRHPYQFDGTVNVTLTVTDSRSNRDTLTKSIDVDGNPAAIAYSIVHDALSLFLLTHETMGAAFAHAAPAQALAEAAGPTSGTDINLDCADSGSITVKEWVDTNADNLINNSEKLKFTAADCAFDTTVEAFTTAGVAEITGDANSAAFSFLTGDTVTFGLNIAPYENWGINGTYAFTYDNSGATPRFGYTATRAKHTLGSSNNGSQTTVFGTADIDANVGSLSEISGTFNYVVGDLDIYGTIINPLDFDKNSGAMQPNAISLSSDVIMLTAGELTIKLGTTTIHVAPSADPSYLDIDVDISSNGTLDLSGRYLQTIAIEPLSNRK